MDSFAGHEYAEKIHLRGRGWDTEGSDFEELMGIGIFSRASCAVALIDRTKCSQQRGGMWYARMGKLGLLTLAAAHIAQWAAASQFVRLDYNIYIGVRYRHSVFLELFDDRPLNEANFLAYVNGNAFDGSFMHRLALNPTTFAPFVIQGGGYYPQLVSEPNVPASEIHYSLNPNLTVDLDGNYATANPTVNGESANTPARSNVKGTVSMALSTGPNSGTSQWFINLASNTFLDTASSGGPFTVFGQVTGDGMSGYVDPLVNSLLIRNLNPDANDDGIREAGPFYNNSAPTNTDGAPIYVANGTFTVPQIFNAEQIDYLSSGLTTDVPAGGLNFTARNTVIDSGTIFTGTGPLGVGVGRNLQVREGFSLGRDLVNHGTVSPGLQIGSIATSNYYQFADGTLEIEIAGPTPDTQHDRLVVLGSAYLAGKLDVHFVGNYMPGLNTTFMVLSAGSITGLFDSLDLPMLASGYVWNITRTSTSYLLTVGAGDFNRDGVVNAADYTVWRDARNTNVTAGTGADADGNGVVNDADYAIWRANFGNVRGTATSGAGAGLSVAGVPEPTSVAILFSGVIWLAAMRRRR